jgi:hypothetical protein
MFFAAPSPFPAPARGLHFQREGDIPPDPNRHRSLRHVSVDPIRDSVLTKTGLARATAIEDGRQSTAAFQICRGVVRLLAAHGMAAYTEVTVANGRRADVVGLSREGEIAIIEIKSCLDDFRTDQKWHEYRDFSDRLFFAVAPDFPREVLPEETGLIIADRYGGEFARAAPMHKLAPARRKALTLQLARLGALRLQSVIDPEARLDGLI